MFDSSTAFRLPDTSVKSPDVAVVALSRWENLTEAGQEKFVPLCPDFVLELRSATDRLQDCKLKIEEWIENGCKLAWLFDIPEKTIYIYQPDKDIHEINGFENKNLTGESVLPDFLFDLTLLK